MLYVMRKIILIVWSLLIISSCAEDGNLAQESVSRTIIVYMAAENDLDADALADDEGLLYPGLRFACRGVTQI
ncbi:hypothetical protein FACS1894177_00030 [Bacteroidia bacterium]|nr:hypothetical protein FACS1894177_00030 [Bacteroidia bacterium]